VTHRGFCQFVIVLSKVPSQEAYSNVCEGKTSLKFPGHNQLTESDNIKHSDSICADNGNMHALL
jgi:hypothetical protein